MASQNLVTSSKLQIEAVQTVTPFKATDPRQTGRVSVTDTADSVIFRTCLNLILYYNKVVDEDSGWMVAGWIKESLAKALVEQPMFSGRLRRGEDGNGELEIFSNDSGVRLIEAKINAMPLSEFLRSKESEGSEADQLVFWKDVDEQNPQYSPLFYVQVTNFECGGYSIGISCSILLADLLIKEDFLRKWANIHNAMLSKNGIKTPIFYLPNLKKANCSPMYTSSSNQNKTCGKTIMFKISDYKNVNLENESGRKLMLVCVEEAEGKLGGKMGAKFPVFVEESSNGIKIESCTKHGDGELVESQLKLRNQVSGASWDDLGANEVAFGQGNKPARVTNWIWSVSDGLVMAIPSSSVEATCELNVIVSIPCEKIILEGFEL